MTTLTNVKASHQRRAADELFRAFAEKINSGELSEGDPLPPEREIVKTYGVSRTVVREAVLALSNKGLVEAKPRFRPVVRRPSYTTALETVDTVVSRLLHEPHGVANLFDTRILIEVSLVREAAKTCTKIDLAMLKEALEKNEAVVEDSEEFYQTDMSFHHVLYQISGNPVLPAIHLAYTGWLSPHWSKMPRSSQRNARNYRAHQAIFDAILQRDPDAAELAIRTHLHEAWQQVAATFKDA